MIRSGQEATPGPTPARGDKPPWVKGLARYEKPDAGKAALQLADTLLPYLGLVTLMFLTIRWGLPYAVTLLVALPTAAFFLRSFIFFHDCCHGSFVASPAARRIIGGVLGVLTFTPFADWRHSHGVHHSTVGNLDKRGEGDVWTMTVDEYEASSGFRRLLYRFYRNPFVMFGLGPILIFVILHRLPPRSPTGKRVRSVLVTDLGLAGIIVAISLTLGFRSYVMVQLPVLLLAGCAGVWLFYVQHQFHPSYWARTQEWNWMDAALRGSSYYKLPAVLQWLSANIGLRHVHHLRPRIRNYNLQRCVNEVPELQSVTSVTLRASLRCARYKLWNEEEKALVGFGDLAREGRIS